MKATSYKALFHYLQSHPKLLKYIQRGNLSLTLCIYLSYICLLGYLYLFHVEFLWAYIIFPGILFLLFSLVRKYMNWKRPYEVFRTAPLIPKETKGKSFPSRHSFSAFLVAVLWIPYFFWVGILLSFFALTISFFRVLLGVHFVRDVVVGSITGILSGYLIYLLLGV